MKINLRSDASKELAQKSPELRIRFTEKERAEIDKAADADTSVWARGILLKAARKRR